MLQPASASDAVDAIADAAALATDTLIIYYAGHGLTAPRTLDLCLALVQSRTNAVHTALPYDWIRQAILAGKAVRKVVILDCCYSGRALIGGMADVTEMAQDAEIEGTYLLAAAAETKKALAPPGEGYTAFTGEFIRVLEEGIVGGPEFLDMTSLYDSVYSALASKSRPLPQQRNRNTVGRIAFARNKSFHVSDGAGDFEDLGQDDQVNTLLGLADALRLKAQTSSDHAILDEAISVYRTAAMRSSSRDLNRARCLASLGDALRLRSEVIGDRGSLDEAITVLREAVTLAPEGHRERPVCLTNLGNALRLRAQETSDSGALAEAVEILRSAVEASQKGQPGRASSLLSLGNTLWGLAAIEGNPDILDDATVSWEQAALTEARIQPRSDQCSKAVGRCRYRTRQYLPWERGSRAWLSSCCHNWLRGISIYLTRNANWPISLDWPLTPLRANLC